MGRHVRLLQLSFIEVMLARKFVLDAVGSCERGDDCVEIGFKEERDAGEKLEAV